MGKPLHHSLQDHTRAHSPGFQRCNDIDLDYNSHMELHRQPKQLALDMRKARLMDTMLLTHLHVADRLVSGRHRDGVVTSGVHTKSPP